jgi:hypothetical protein
VSREVTMDAYANFTVENDSEGVIGTVLTVVTAAEPQEIQVALAPDGDGISTEAIGSVHRVRTRDELPPPLDNNPDFDPQVQELWLLYREWDRTHRNTASTVMRGSELRELVSRAVALRAKLG